MVDINEWMKKVGIKQVQPSIENSPLMDRTLAQDARQNYIDNNKKQMAQRLASRINTPASPSTTEQALDVLYNTATSDETANLGAKLNGQSTSEKLNILNKTKGFAKEIANNPIAKNILQNAKDIANSPTGKAIGKVGGTIGRKVLTPLAVADLLVNAGIISANTYNNIKAHKDFNKTMDTIDTYNFMVEQGADPLATWQALNGIDPNADIPKVNGKPTSQQNITKAQGELEALQQQKAQTDTELAKEQALYDNAKMSYENRLREIQAQKVVASGGGNNNNVPPATPPVMDDNNPNNNNNNNIQSVVPDVVNRVGASVGMNTQDNSNNNNDKIQDVQNTEDANVQQPVTDQQPTFEEQLQQTIINPTGNLSTEELSNRLADIANQYRQTAQNHYLYNGQAIDPTVGQYNVDPRALRMAQMGDMVANTLGLDVNRTKNLLGIANAEYQANMGNQLGVPYENYILAMGERRKAELDSYSQQMNQQLELAKQQASTLSEKLKYLQAQEKLRQDTALGYAKIDADVQNNIRNNQTDIAVQDLSNQGMLTDRQMRELAETDRQNRLQPIQEQKATADLIEALSWVNDPNQRAWLVMTNPDLQMRLFGRRINPQNANDINALNAFVKGSYGIDMYNMGRVNQQQQGLLQNIANRIRGNN